jgi:hypothetical protein
MLSCLLEKEKGKKKRNLAEESPAHNQPNNLSPPYISDLKSFSIALYASAATILFGVAPPPPPSLSQAYDVTCKSMTSPCLPLLLTALPDRLLPPLHAGFAVTMFNRREMCGGQRCRRWHGEQK